MEAANYWTRVLRRRVARRQAIIAGGTTGLGALFLAACGSSNNNASNAPSTGAGTSSSSGSSGASSSSGSPTGGSGSAQSSLVSKPVDTSSSATKGGVLNLQGGEPNSFDFTAGSGAPTFSGYVYSRLMKYKTFKYPDPPVATPVPDAATSWETSPDGLTYTYKLRQGMKFDPRPPTNGRALTSQDVLFSWNRFVKLSSFGSQMANSVDPTAPVLSVTAPDDSTVVAKLAFPFGPFNINYAYYRYGQIMPTESEGGGFNPKSDARGSGVWRLKSYSPSVNYEYERNPDWYDANNVYLDGINTVILPEYSTILAQFEAGKLGTYDKIQAQDILPAKQAHPQMVLQAGETFLTASPWIRMSYLPNSPFRDERVRQALSMLLDRDLYISTFGNVDKFKAQGLDISTRWNTVIPSGMDPYWLDPKNQSAFGDGAKYFQYSPAEAKKLLSAAGFSGPIQTRLLIQPVQHRNWQPHFNKCGKRKETSS